MINTIKINRDDGTVFKQIKRNNPINEKIAFFLSTYYNYSDPLIEREVEILKKLEPYDISPRVLDVTSEGYSMSYCGQSLHELAHRWYLKLGIGIGGTLKALFFPSRIDRQFNKKVETRVEYILHVLAKTGIKHNDIYNENILIDDKGEIRINDFLFANDDTVAGVGDLFPELSIRHDFIFCARMTDTTLYQACKKFYWRKFRKQIMEDIRKSLPKEKGSPGAHVASGVVYHGLPFKEIEVPHHRKFSSVRLDNILEKLPCHARKGLDIGCSIGSMCFALQAKGKRMTGIDYDPESIHFANKINAYKGYRISFMLEDFTLKYVREKMSNYDFVVWLSNWMWIAKSQGVDEAKQILYEVSKRSKFMFFDTAQGGTDKADSFHLDGVEAVYALLKENTVYQYIEDLGLSEKGYHQRNLFFCSG